MKKSFVALALAIAAPAFGSDARITGNELVEGAAPQLAVSGLTPNERVRVHSLRKFTLWEDQGSKGWQPVPKMIHAWADYRADKAGAINLNSAPPVAGTFSGADPYGILWSGHPVGVEPDPFFPKGVKQDEIAIGETRIVVSRGALVIASAKLVSRPPSGLIEQEVSEGHVNGAFAAPADGRRHPTLILLHGSEGGNRDAARDLARRFAGQGYAAFALNYFAWDLAKIEGIPNAHVNQPIELLTRTRAWLARRPEADVERFGVYGHSKGAEYAAIASTRLPWIDAVAACVPSDAIWQGYGVGDERNRAKPKPAEPKLYSSFSWKGRPFAYIPLSGDRKPFRSNTDFYESKRNELGSKVTAALIPIERSRASFLWLGGGRDEVWASGAMAKRLDARMKAAGKAAKSDLVVYERAGHAICGEGGYPTRLWQNDSSDPRDPDLDANGRATVDGWSRIKEFFARTLK